MLHPTHHRDKLEMDFHGAYFKHADCFGDLNRVFEIGERDAMKHGIPVMDASTLPRQTLRDAKSC